LAGEATVDIAGGAAMAIPGVRGAAEAIRGPAIGQPTPTPETTTTEVPSAIQRETTPLFQSLQKQPGEGAGEVPAGKGLGETGERGQPTPPKEEVGPLPPGGELLIGKRRMLRSERHSGGVEVDAEGERLFL